MFSMPMIFICQDKILEITFNDHKLILMQTVPGNEQQYTMNTPV